MLNFNIMCHMKIGGMEMKLQLRPTIPTVRLFVVQNSHFMGCCLSYWRSSGHNITEGSTIFRICLAYISELRLQRTRCLIILLVPREHQTDWYL
jgi:hypothetical protein